MCALWQARALRRPGPSTGPLLHAGLSTHPSLGRELDLVSHRGQSRGSVSQSTVQGSAELFEGGQMLPPASVNCWAVWEDFLGEAVISKHRSSFRDEFRRARGRRTAQVPPLPQPTLPGLPSFLVCANLLRRPEGSRGGNLAPQLPNEEKLLTRKKKNINPIVSAPRSCLKNKNNLKLQLGRFSLARH